MSHHDNQLHSRNVHPTNPHHPEPSTVLTFTVLLSLVLASTLLTFTVLLSAMLPFAALHRAVSTSASFILWLFISWKFHVTDGQNRSLIFRVKRMPTSFPIFLLLPHPTSTYPISAHPTQHRYPIALFVLLNVCDATSDLSTFIYLSKSQPNQISHLTVPPP